MGDVGAVAFLMDDGGVVPGVRIRHASRRDDVGLGATPADDVPRHAEHADGVGRGRGILPVPVGLVRPIRALEVVTDHLAPGVCVPDGRKVRIREPSGNRLARPDLLGQVGNRAHRAREQRMEGMDRRAPVGIG